MANLLLSLPGRFGKRSAPVVSSPDALVANRLVSDRCLRRRRAHDREAIPSGQSYPPSHFSIHEDRFEMRVLLSIRILGAPAGWGSLIDEEKRLWHTALALAATLNTR